MVFGNLKLFSNILKEKKCLQLVTFVTEYNIYTVYVPVLYTYFLKVSFNIINTLCSVHYINREHYYSNLISSLNNSHRR